MRMCMLSCSSWPENNVLICRRLDSIQVWKAFASTYPCADDMSLKRKAKRIEWPNMGMRDYIMPLISPECRWITFLSLSSLTCSRTDLAEISLLSNLGMLTVGPSVVVEGIGLDDSIIRTWSRIAANSEAFSMLRVLNLRSQSEITDRIFEYLQDFPTLNFLNMETFRPDHHINAVGLPFGWHHCSGKSHDDWLVQDGAKDRSWDSLTHTCFSFSIQQCKRSSTTDNMEAANASPTLQLSLGESANDVASEELKYGRLESFTRPTEVVAAQRGMMDCRGERPSNRDHSTIVHKGIKKPSVRASKRQKIEDLLIGLCG